MLIVYQTLVEKRKMFFTIAVSANLLFLMWHKKMCMEYFGL